MKFNAEKCKVMYIGKKNRQKFEYSISTTEPNQRHISKETSVERDLGIYISNDLKWKTQAQYASNKANLVLGALKRTLSNWTC